MRLCAARAPRVARLAARQPRRALSTFSEKEKFNTSTLQDDKHLFPDLVLEEEKFGYEAGLPMVPDAETFKERNDDPDHLVRGTPAQEG